MVNDATGVHRSNGTLVLGALVEGRGRKGGGRSGRGGGEEVAVVVICDAWCCTRPPLLSPTHHHYRGAVVMDVWFDGSWMCRVLAHHCSPCSPVLCLDRRMCVCREN